jgi:hypothetical protein
VFAALLAPFYAPFGRSRRSDSPVLTYGELLNAVHTEAEHALQRETFAHIPFRVGTQSKLLDLPADLTPAPRDPDLHPALQDLGNEINEDIHEALDTLDDPGAYYPGVDAGIAPVTDEHVRLVIWALQRELNRELRSPSSQPGLAVLPAAPLADLPWHVQRALAERRRWRFQQCGIGRGEWERNEWSLWNVPMDDDYVPRRAHRLLSIQRAA